MNRRTLSALSLVAAFAEGPMKAVNLSKAGSDATRIARPPILQQVRSALQLRTETVL
jgi:hypothetical protein